MTSKREGPYFVGVDVGTGSARAALVTTDGTILAESTYATKTFRLESDSRIFEQSTEDIWSQISSAVNDVLRDSKIDKSKVKGIGFDATCSLAVTDRHGNAITVTPETKYETGGERNVVLWADHRAEEEAKLINSTGSMVLNYVGKTMSLEMEIPKVLWLKKHMPSKTFSNSMFFDLPDYLTYRATGSKARSNCSLVCKCSYVPPGVDGSTLGWQPDFFKQIGLEDLIENNFEQLGGIPGRGGIVLTAGQPVGQGLSEQAASELGLEKGTAVGSGLIDAYAGWVGTIAAKSTNGPQEDTNLIDSQYRLAAIAGTSTCHCVQSPNGILVDGVWGPYKHAVFPGMWMNEGGQSSTGQLIDFIIETHPASTKLKEMSKEKGENMFTILHSILDDLSKSQKLPSLSHLTHDLTIYPDLHGNRSPLADSSMRGLISGLRLDQSLNDLALKYFATLEAISLQTRHIIESMNQKGHKIKSLYMSGGQVKNKVFMQLIADVCGIQVQLPFSHSASVVAGSAILGRFAYDLKDGKGITIESQKQAEEASFAHRDHLWNLMTEMTKPGTLVFPTTDEKRKALLDAKYTVFREAIETQRRWRDIVQKAM